MIPPTLFGNNVYNRDIKVIKIIQNLKNPETF